MRSCAAEQVILKTMSRLSLRASPLTDVEVLLRYWSDDDLAPLVAALQDPEISRWVYPIPWPYTEKDGAEFIQFAENERSGDTGAHLGVLHPSSNEILGSVALTKIDWENASAHLGYWTAKEARNQGVARRASRLVIEWAFDGLGLERIELLCDPENIPSQRVAEALGFRREGHLRGHLKLPQGRRDSLLYGLLRTDALDSWPSEIAARSDRSRAE